MKKALWKNWKNFILPKPNVHWKGWGDCILWGLLGTNINYTFNDCQQMEKEGEPNSKTLEETQKSESKSTCCLGQFKWSALGNQPQGHILHLRKMVMLSCISKPVKCLLSVLGQNKNLPPIVIKATFEFFSPNNTWKSADLGQTGLFFHGFLGSHFDALPLSWLWASYLLVFLKLK